MTGALTINMQGGTLNTIGLRIINTLSGAVIHAEKELTSSGSITAEGMVIAQGASAGLVARNNAGLNRVYTNINSDNGELILNDSLSSPDAKIAANGISYLMDGLAIGATTADAGLALEVIGTISGAILTICVGKSTYARCGIITNVTPFEPEWEGHVTLEISNTTPLPAKVYADEGICQVLFFEADEDDVCETSYADKAGKYQGQRGVTLPRL